MSRNLFIATITLLSVSVGSLINSATAVSVPDTESDAVHVERRDVNSNNPVIWLGHEIPYVLTDSWASDVKSTILEAMGRIENSTNHCVRFVPKAARHFDYLEIGAFDKPDQFYSSCSAPIGNQGKGNNRVSILGSCTHIGFIMRMLMHTLGFDNEQKRPDRDNYVDVDFTNILYDEQYRYRKVAFDKASNGTPYDFSSIMHYTPYEFALEGRLPVLTPKVRFVPGLRMYPRSHISENDVKRVQRLYSCPEDTSKVNKGQASDTVIDCDFDNQTFCSFTQDTDDDFDWQIGTASTPTPGAGPQADHTTGIGYYAYAEGNGHSNQVATLTSPEMPAGTYCLKMHVLMSGNEGGSIDIVLRSGSAPDDVTSLGAWYYPWHFVAGEKTFDKPWRLTLRVKMSSGHNTDFAMDDIRVIKGNCKLD